MIALAELNKWRCGTMAALKKLGPSADAILKSYYAKPFTEKHNDVVALRLLEPELLAAGFAPLYLNKDSRIYTKYGEFPMRCFVQHKEGKIEYTLCADVAGSTVEVAQYAVEKQVVTKVKFDVASLVKP